MYYIIVSNEPNSIDKYGILLQIGWIFYLIAIWLMLLSFASRIDYTFKGAQKLQFSPLSITTLYTLLIILLILLLTLGITNISSAYDSALYIGYAALIFHFIFCCFLSYLLFVKIFIFMQSRFYEQIKLSGINGQYKDNDETETDVSSVKLDSIFNITKFTILMFTGILSTYIASILIFLDVEFLWSQKVLNNEDTDLFILSSIFLAFDIMINALCAYLLFGFNDKKYYFICGLCHKFCQKGCVLCVYSNDFSDKIRTKDEYTNLILGEVNDNKEP